MTNLALVLLFSGTAAGTGASDWTTTRITQGIVVSKRDVAGSPVVAFKGEGNVDAPLGVVATVIYDTTRAPEWIADLKQSRIQRWTASDEFIEYDQVVTPPVMKDRDFVSDVKLDAFRDEQRVVFHYKSTTDPDLPETKKYVRGDLMSTIFTLTRVNDGKTHVIAEIHCDPKGDVPKWIVNWVQADWPMTTFKNLRSQVKKTDITVDPWFRNALSQ